jgi:hypothetical protein
MKHLRKFNEGVNLEDIKYFCETSLAYLLDEGVTVRVSGYNKEEEEVTIDFHEKMTWNECKDHVIPLLIRVVNKYELGEFGGGYFIHHQKSRTGKNITFCVRGTHGIRVDVSISCDEINDIEQKLSKQWEGNLIMDKIIFYVRNEK